MDVCIQTHANVQTNGGEVHLNLPSMCERVWIWVERSYPLPKQRGRNYEILHSVRGPSPDNEQPRGPSWRSPAWPRPQPRLKQLSLSNDGLWGHFQSKKAPAALRQPRDWAAMRPRSGSGSPSTQTRFKGPAGTLAWFVWLTQTHTHTESVAERWKSADRPWHQKRKSSPSFIFDSRSNILLL